MSFEGLEHGVLSLPEELENRYILAESERKNNKKGKKTGDGGSIELKQLKWLLKDEVKKCRRGEESQSIMINL